MFHTTGSAIAMCTVRCHPEGGYAPVLHLSSTPAPEPVATGISLPTPAEAAQYARNHFGTLPVVVAEECHQRSLTRR
ncbi:hypothetical protein [Nocardioides pakistanensis]